MKTKTEQRADVFDSCMVWQGIFSRYQLRWTFEKMACEAGLANAHVAKYTEVHMDASMETRRQKLEAATTLGLNRH